MYVLPLCRLNMKSPSSWADQLHLATLVKPKDRDITPVAVIFADCAKTLRESAGCLPDTTALHYQRCSDAFRRLSYDSTLQGTIFESHRTALQRWRQAQRGDTPSVKAGNSLRTQLMLMEVYGLESLHDFEKNYTHRMIETWNEQVSQKRGESSGVPETNTGTINADATDLNPLQEQQAPFQHLNPSLDFSSNIRKHFSNQWDSSEPGKLGNALLQRFSSGFQMATSFDDMSTPVEPFDSNLPDGAAELRDRVIKRANGCLAEARSIASALDAAAVALTQLSKSLRGTVVRISLVPSINQAVEEILQAEASAALELAVALAKLQHDVRIEPLESALLRDEATWRQLCGATRVSRERTTSVDSAKRSIAALMMDDSKKSDGVLDAPVKSKVTALSFEAYQTSARTVLGLCDEIDLESLRSSINDAANVDYPDREPLRVSTEEIHRALDTWAEEERIKVDPGWPGDPLTEDMIKASTTADVPLSAKSVINLPKSDTNPPKWLTPLMSGSDNILRKMMKKPSSLQSGDREISPETSLLVQYFWPEDVDEASVVLLKSFSCSFREKSAPWPTQYGRLFCTQSKLVYCSWSRRALTVPWQDIDVLEPTENTMNSDALTLQYKREGSEDSAVFVFAGVHKRDEVLELYVELKKKAKEQHELSRKSIKTPPSGAAGTDADAVLGRMEHILTKRMSDISIQDLYQTVWSEEKPFYKPWLERSNCFEVQMGSWVEEPNIVGPFCKEAYSKKREIHFKFKRTTHLYIGPPVANVKQV